MKILLISDYGVPRGGNEIVTLALRQSLKERGHDVRLFASSAYANGIDNLADYQCFGTKSSLRAALWCANPSAFVRLRRVLAEFRPDVVHVRLMLSQMSPLILPLLRDTPSIYHEGWYRTVCPIGSKVLPDGRECRESAGAVCYRSGCVPLAAWPLAMTQLRLWRRWRGVFDAVVANSQSVANWLTTSGIAPVEVIYNGVVAHAPRPPLTGPPTIVFAGRLAFEKGVDVLLDFMGFLRVNLRGREPQGVVEPGSDYFRLLDRVEADLKCITDPVSGAPAVRHIARTVDVFGAMPHESLPDIFFDWAPTSYPKRRVDHPNAVLEQKDMFFVRESRHNLHGFFAAAGPGIMQGKQIADMSVLDVAPTCLHLMGQPVPKTMRGAVATDVFV